MGKNSLVEFEQLSTMMGSLIEINKTEMVRLENKLDEIDKDMKYLLTKNQDLEIKIKESMIKANDANKTAIIALEKVSIRDDSAFDEEWASQTEIGLDFEPSLSSHQVGWLLREVGLAKKLTRKITPLREAHIKDWVKRGHFTNYNAWFWRREVVKEKIIEHMKNINKYLI